MSAASERKPTAAVAQFVLADVLRKSDASIALEGLAAGADPQKMAYLSDRNQDCRRRDKPCNDRVAQKIGRKPKLGTAHDEEHEARESRQQDCGGQVIRGTLGGDGAGRSRRHQGNDGDRPHGERAARSEKRICDQRQDARIEANLRRQSRQHRIGERLRDQHDGHDDRGREIAGEASPSHSGAPMRAPE